MKKTSAATQLTQQVGVSKSRGLEAIFKAQLIGAVLHEVNQQQLTHAELAQAITIDSDQPRSS